MNAIILAAGMGTRLRPLTNDIPKCLVKVCGVPIVERQIQFLNEAGISDITLVSGYKAEKLDYLREKYGVSIVYNERYDTCNNIYSLYKVLDRFKDTYVIEGDVFMNTNCFIKDIGNSTYFSSWKESYDNEWGLIVDNNNRLTKIAIGNGKGYIMSGISFWTVKDAIKVASEIKRLINEGEYLNLFWDNAILNLYEKLEIKVHPINHLYEIDTEDELRKVEERINQL